MDRPWEPITIDEVQSRFEPTGVDWWVAGGVAIDMFLGWQTRPHEDLDIEMFKTDRDALFDVFEGWELFFVTESKLHPWHRGMEMAPEVFGVWGRSSTDAPWAIEIMLADGDGETWRFRRDNEISVPRSRLTRSTSSGVHYCAPEVQLLFKSKKRRPKDDADMVRCLHRLDADQRSWLSDALGRSEPTHAWIDLIAQAEIGGTE